MKSVAIIGAGITGLTAAFYLKRKGMPVTVYEASGRVGGVIQSLRQDGYLAEFGPNTILETSPKIAPARPRRRSAIAPARSRSEGRGALCRALPAAHRDAGLAAGLFHDQTFHREAKLAVLREPFVPRRRDGKEESIAEFVVRRLNQEFLDHAIDALVAGIYAGDPYKLSAAAGVSRSSAQLEARYGSLIKGQIFGARDRKEARRGGQGPRAKIFLRRRLAGVAGYAGGAARRAVKLNTAVTRLTQTR